MKILVSNNGPHPADKWAELTANEIMDLIQIADPAEQQTEAQQVRLAAMRKAKRELYPLLCELFENAHKACQDGERGELAKARGERRLAAKLDPMASTTTTMANLLALMDQTPFAEHFQKEEVKAVLTRMIGQHQANIMHIERSYFADRNPNLAEAQAFRETSQPK